MSDFEDVCEELESTRDLMEAVEATRTLVFDSDRSVKSVVSSLEVADRYFEPESLVSNEAQRELETLYVRHHSELDMPDVLLNWDGDFRKDTKEIYQIARGEVRDDEVERYQRKMRDKLPSQIPLVRGGKPNHGRDLCSWSSSIYTAQVYDSSEVSYTVVSPEDVFMCSLYGEYIGEQEYTLLDYEIEETFVPTLENQIRFNRRMDDVLS